MSEFVIKENISDTLEYKLYQFIMRTIVIGNKQGISYTATAVKDILAFEIMIRDIVPKYEHYSLLSNDDIEQGIGRVISKLISNKDSIVAKFKAKQSSKGQLVYSNPESLKIISNKNKRENRVKEIKKAINILITEKQKISQNAVAKMINVDRKLINRDYKDDYNRIKKELLQNNME